MYPSAFPTGESVLRSMRRAARPRIRNSRIVTMAPTMTKLSDEGVTILGYSNLWGTCTDHFTRSGIDVKHLVRFQMHYHRTDDVVIPHVNFRQALETPLVGCLPKHEMR